MIRIQQLEPEQGEYALHRERTPIDKVPIEQIWIGLRGQSVDFENVEQIVELTVDVATNGEFALVRHGDVHQRGLLLEQGLHVAEDLEKRKNGFQKMIPINVARCTPFFGINLTVKS